MDVASITAIIIALAVIYFFVKIVVSPVVKAILGVIIFLIALYLLQHYFGFNLNKILSPLGIYPEKWGINLNWLTSPVTNAMATINNYSQIFKGK